MVAMQMRINEETNIIRTQCFNSTVNLIRERRELIIDHQCSIFANEHADITARTLQKIKILSHLNGPDFTVSKFS